MDRVLTLDPPLYSHSWECGESGCGGEWGCEGDLCPYTTVMVTRKGVGEQKTGMCEKKVVMKENCGTGVMLEISKKNAKKLGYQYFEILELIVIGRKQGNQIMIYLIFLIRIDR